MPAKFVLLIPFLLCFLLQFLGLFLKLFTETPLFSDLELVTAFARYVCATSTMEIRPCRLVSAVLFRRYNVGLALVNKAFI